MLGEVVGGESAHPDDRSRTRLPALAHSTMVYCAALALAFFPAEPVRAGGGVALAVRVTGSGEWMLPNAWLIAPP